MMNGGGTMQRGGIFRISNYCEVGSSHIKWGKLCEDAVVSGVHPETGIAAAVVSDGAGSCQFAREGAQVTAQTALRVLLEQFDTLFLLPEEYAAADILTPIRQALAEYAESLSTAVEELSATLVCAAMAPDGRWLMFHVGDGIIAVCEEGGQCQVLSQYHHAIARNYTTFVTIPDTSYHLERGKGGVSAFLLTSDGPEYLVTSEEGWLTVQAELLMQMGVFFHESRICEEMQKLTAYFKSIGMYDDASFSLLADRRFAPQVFSGMDRTLRNLVFYLPEQINRRVERQLRDCYALLASHPEGVTEQQMMRALHTHNKWNTLHKLAGPLTAEAMFFSEGRYYF